MLWWTVSGGSFVTEPKGTIEKQTFAWAPRTLAVNHLDKVLTIVEICHGIQSFQGIQGAIVL